MQILKIHNLYLIKLYLKNLLIVISVFASLTFILNILEEIKFFAEMDIGLYYPFLFTFLNLPTILFEIFPFIILITTQIFFIHLYNKDEIIILKNYGVKNFDIIKILSIVAFSFGLFLVIIYYTFSSNLKYTYLSFKNSFTNDNKYLAVINDNGLWIKDEVNEIVNIINAEKIEDKFLKNVSISQLNEDYKVIKTLYAEKINIENKQWLIDKADIFDLKGKNYQETNLNFYSNFDLNKINNLFSNLTSLNMLQLITHYRDYKNLGYSTLDIESYINKIISIPFYLVLMILIGSILMMNVKYNKSKIFNIIVGVLISVMIYYIDYFFNLLGTNERIPVILSIWFPIFILLMFSTVGLIKINEK